jgi:serine/threonine protein kinase
LIFELAYDMQRDLLAQGRSAYLRLMRDTIPKQSIIIYDYATDHLLSLAQKEISLSARKRILRDTLRGLAELHKKNIVHGGTRFLAKSLFYSNVTNV